MPLPFRMNHGEDAIWLSKNKVGICDVAIYGITKKLYVM